MSLFSRKFTFLIGSVVGSLAGLLFAAGSGKQMRARLLAARTPQQRFEVIFREYLRAGRQVLSEIEESGVLEDVAQGGREILKELQRRTAKEGGTALRTAQTKTKALIRDAERQLRGRGGVQRKIKRTLAKAKRVVKTKATKAKRAMKKAVRRR